MFQLTVDFVFIASIFVINLLFQTIIKPIWKEYIMTISTTQSKTVCSSYNDMHNKVWEEYISTGNVILGQIM